MSRACSKHCHHITSRRLDWSYSYFDLEDFSQQKFFLRLGGTMNHWMNSSRTFHLTTLSRYLHLQLPRVFHHYYWFWGLHIDYFGLTFYLDLQAFLILILKGLSSCVWVIYYLKKDRLLLDLVYYQKFHPISYHYPIHAMNDLMKPQKIANHLLSWTDSIVYLSFVFSS